MLVYLGFLRSTTQRHRLRRGDRAMVAAIGGAPIPCPECEGTGWWAYAEPEIPGGPCVECKGTAVRWVNA